MSIAWCRRRQQANAGRLVLLQTWKITELVLDIAQQRLDITLEWPSGRKASCPVCNKRCGLKDHLPIRTWRHLDAMQFKTFLHCRIPRSECRTHGAKTISVPWAEAGSSWTLLFEAFAVMVMEQVPSLTKAASILGISWKEAHTLRRRAVGRGLKRRCVDQIDYLGIDEKSFGRKDRFITVLTDPEGERVLEVARSKSSDAATKVLEVIPKEKRGAVAAVAMDMSAAMEKACREQLPNADIVYDKFHIEKQLSEAMGKVRSREHKKLLADGVPIFKGTRYLFLRRREKWSKEQRAQYRDIQREFGATRFSQSRICRMWAVREAFRPFWNYVSETWAAKYFQRWYFWVTHSRIPELIRAAKTLKKLLANILTYFRHGITNAFTEGMNSRIQEIKSASRGFRYFENYRIAILFSCGKLDMRPTR
jgi:transposase